MFGECDVEWVAIPAHRVIGEGGAFPRLHADELGRRAAGEREDAGGEEQGENGAGKFHERRSGG